MVAVDVKTTYLDNTVTNAQVTNGVFRLGTGAMTDDKKKKPDVKDNVDLKYVSKKDDGKHKFEIHNDTDHK